MINFLNRRFHLSKSFNFYLKDDIKSARQHLDIYFSKGGGAGTAFAFSGTLCILENNTERAKSDFMKSIDIVSKKRGYNATYVKLYCDYYICLIEKCSNCETTRLQAIEVPSSKYIKNWLSLPQEEVRLNY